LVFGALAPTPNPQSPIPNPQSPIKKFYFSNNFLKKELIIKRPKININYI